VCGGEPSPGPRSVLLAGTVAGREV
jgi:hypothetical protein